MLKKIKNMIAQKRNSGNRFIKLSVSVLTHIYHMPRFVKRICFDPDFRYVRIMRLFHPNLVHQTTPVTCSNRYPEVFIECLGYFAGTENIRILSFGCSTGEEVLTLREYFPHATIVGADINKRSLKTCRKLPVDEKISFVYSTPKNLKELGTFDAIFCMAVFQRTPHHIANAGITDISELYPFDKFEKQIVFLRDMINPQGLLIVHFAQYSLADTCAASGFKAYGNCTQITYGLPVFDKNCKLIEDAPPFHSIYIKV